MKTPELDKMTKVQDKSQTIGVFLDWLSNEKELEICTYDDDDEDPAYHSCHETIEQLLAEYFDIDLVKCENERRKILEGLQKKAKTKK